MSTPYGFCITRQGNALLAKLLSSNQLEITRVMIGSGRPAEDANLMDLETMIQPIARATSTFPLTVGTTTSFVVEYRNDMGGELLDGEIEAPPTGQGLSRDISINEFAVFANDPDKGEIMLYYCSLGDYPDSVKAYSPGDGVISRRYPVSITVVEGVEVILDYAAGAYMMAEDIVEYCQKALLPQIFELLPEKLEEHFDIHNKDPEAHPGLTARVRATELALNGSETILSWEGDPTTETVGQKGQHYINAKTGAEFECTEVNKDGYIWNPVEDGKSVRDLLGALGNAETTLADVDARLGLLELMYRTQVNGNPFTVSFSDMSDLVVTGVWNETLKRVEF